MRSHLSQKPLWLKYFYVFAKFPRSAHARIRRMGFVRRLLLSRERHHRVRRRNDDGKSAKSVSQRNFPVAHQRASASVVLSRTARDSGIRRAAYSEKSA